MSGVWSAERVWRLGMVVREPPPPEALARLEDWGLAVALFVHEEDEDGEAASWQLYVYAPPERDIEALRGSFADLLAELGIRADSFVSSLMVDRDWIRQASMLRGPVEVGRILIHAPGAPPPPDRVAIALEAGLAFGSGEHGSTRGCLAALDALARRKRPQRILDLGTGSGILAIAAAKLWPRCRVLAVDHDPLAVAVARANVQQNGVAGRVAVAVSEGYRSAWVRRAGPFDLILANLLADPLLRMARDLRTHLAPGGVAVLAGLLEREEAAVLAGHRLVGLRLVGRLAVEGWSTLVVRRPRRRLSRRRTRTRGRRIRRAGRSA